MKAILRCIGLWVGDTTAETCRAGKSSTRRTLGHARHTLRYEPSSLCFAGRRLGMSEERRRQMILDTERYLNNPRNKVWPRLAG